MWTANAATIAPSADTSDQKVHFTAANLIAKLHRSLEPKLTSDVLKKIFSNPQCFSHHDPLPAHLDFGDEGAANHTRFCSNYGKKGLQFFVYGRKCFSEHGSHQRLPLKFPARQTFEACQSIARLHQLSSDQVVYAQQNPDAIDAGVFHNDVVAVGNLNTLFYHEEAYLDSKRVIGELAEKYQRLNGEDLQFIEVKSKDVSLQDAVRTYLFNSQLISIPNQGNEMTLIAPIECQENERVKTYLDSLIRDSNQPIRKVHFVDIRQSMKNGGGPACLRLRVVLNENEIQKTHPSVFLTESLYEELVRWIEKNYRDQLSVSDLIDPKLVQESYDALDQLTKILNLGDVYPFQK
jgi:succinylarginine dihydrolase